VGSKDNLEKPQMPTTYYQVEPSLMELTRWERINLARPPLITNITFGWVRGFSREIQRLKSKSEPFKETTI
jgi:hypothetical protein